MAIEFDLLLIFLHLIQSLACLVIDYFAMDFDMFALASSCSSYSSITNLIFVEHLNFDSFFFSMKVVFLCYFKVYFYFEM